MNTQHVSCVASYRLCLLLFWLAVLARSCGGCSSSNFPSCSNCSECVSQKLWWCDASDTSSKKWFFAYCAPPSFGCRRGYDQYLQDHRIDCKKDADDDSGLDCSDMFTFRTQYDCNVGVGFCAPHLPNSRCIGLIYLGAHLFSIIVLLLLLGVLPHNASSSQMCMTVSLSPDAPPCSAPKRL
jgi:hypothetical protein